MFLLTSDLHLTDNPRDAYRFGLFDWLQMVIRKEVKTRALFILGDITDEKDNHSAELVNKIVTCLTELSEIVPIFILKGNHDYVEQSNPFFGFLSHLPNIRFVIEPEKADLEGKNFLLLPHTPDPYGHWQNIEEDWFTNADYIFLHQTLTGSLASNGMEMKGMNRSYFENLDARIISGDIHVPQNLGNVTYVGTPYRVRYGDNFEPRVLVIKENGGLKSIKFPCIKKHTIVISRPDDLHKHDLNPGDQVKVRMRLTKADVVDWKLYKKEVMQICKELKLDLYGIEVKIKKRTKLLGKVDTKKLNPQATDTEIFRDFCADNSIDQGVVAFGRKFLDAN